MTFADAMRHKAAVLEVAALAVKGPPRRCESLAVIYDEFLRREWEDRLTELSGGG